MMTLAALTALFPLALTSVPAFAKSEAKQTDAIEKEKERVAFFDGDDFKKLLQDIYPQDYEPIAPEQLALGEQVATAMFPQGSYRRVMNETFRDLLQPMLESINFLDNSRIISFAGVDLQLIEELDIETKRQISAIADPNIKERNAASVGAITQLMASVAEEIEPDIRKGLSRAYAKRFEADELQDIIAFMQTPSGQKFGTETFPMLSGREVASAAIQATPRLLERFGDLEGIIEETTSGLPPERALDDLDANERQLLAQLLGVEETNLGAYSPDYGDDNDLEVTTENSSEEDIDE